MIVLRHIGLCLRLSFFYLTFINNSENPINYLLLFNYLNPKTKINQIFIFKCQNELIWDTISKIKNSQLSFEFIKKILLFNEQYSKQSSIDEVS